MYVVLIELVLYFAKSTKIGTFCVDSFLDATYLLACLFALHPQATWEEASLSCIVWYLLIG